MSLILNPDSYVHGVEYAYDRSYCKGNCPDYCRCTQILGERVTEISSWTSLLESFCTVKLDPIDQYAVERFLRRILSLKDFEVETTGGYYGEEVLGVRYCGNHVQQFEAFNKLPNQTSRLRYALLLEYGYLLPEIEQVSEWEIRKVAIKDVRAFDGHMRHVNPETVGSYQTSPSFLTCLCVPDGAGQYRLIDGRHRLTSAVQSGKRKIEILVPKGSATCKLSQEQIRDNALAKLSPEEKLALGLEGVTFPA